MQLYFHIVLLIANAFPYGTVQKLLLLLEAGRLLARGTRAFPGGLFSDSV